MSAYSVSEGSQEGHDTLVLAHREEELQAAFAPSVGMVGCSLRHRGEELLGQRGGLAKYAEAGSSMGIPLLHPWANRLDGLRYGVDGREVELDPEATPAIQDRPGLHPLPSVRGEIEFRHVSLAYDGQPVLQDLSFHVPAGRTLAIETTLTASGDVAVPVAFGYHPYLRLPGAPRPQWRVTLPVRRRARLDERGIPTGDASPVRMVPGPLGARDFDDLFVELVHPPEFLLEGAGRRLEVRFEQGYPVAQVYGPGSEEHVCFEPMTAPTNALVSGQGLRLVPPGDRYLARFSVSVVSL